MAAVTYRRFRTALELGTAAAEVIVRQIAQSVESGRPFLLGCPGGRTPRPIYRAMGRLCNASALDCSRVVIVMMDEYLDSYSVTPRTVPENVHNSCLRFAKHEILHVINHGLSFAKTIPLESVWIPDPRDPVGYDARIRDAGGVDLFLTASGASDGHVAFCGPGSAIDGATSIVELAQSTRTDNLVTFPEFDSLADVPTHGVSVGLGTIRRYSRSVWMLLHGADKTESARRVRSVDSYDPDWPATFIHECPNAQVWLDATAEGNHN